MVHHLLPDNKPIKVFLATAIILLLFSFSSHAIRRIGGTLPMRHSVFDAPAADGLAFSGTLATGNFDDPRQRRPKPVKSMQVHGRDARALFIAGGACIAVGLPTALIAGAGAAKETSNLPTLNMLLMLAGLLVCTTGLILLISGVSIYRHYGIGRML